MTSTVKGAGADGLLTLPARSTLWMRSACAPLAAKANVGPGSQPENGPSSSGQATDAPGSPPKAKSGVPSTVAPALGASTEGAPGAAVSTVNAWPVGMPVPAAFVARVEKK